MIQGSKIRLIISLTVIISTLAGIFINLDFASLKAYSKGSFNSNLTQPDLQVPVLTTDKKNISTDAAMLSFIPYKSGNPRSLATSGSETVGFQIYFNNGGDAAIDNPTIKAELIKETETNYRIRTSLFSANDTVNTASESKGGDLLFTVPPDSQVSVAPNSTRLYKNVLTVYPSYPNDTSNNTTNLIPDTKSEESLTNPIFSNNGYKILESLDSGAANYGFITSKLIIQPKSNNTNNKPVLDNQYLTIEKGNKKSFRPHSCLDKDGDSPCTYNVESLPSFCSNDPQTRIVSCNTDSETPKVAKFSILPIDSKGLAGIASEYTVNTIEPDAGYLIVEKKCNKKDTVGDCGDTNLVQGDLVNIAINVKVVGSFPITGVQVLESFDKDELFEISDIAPTADLNIENGKITTIIGTMSPGETKKISYTAKIKEGLENGRRVLTKTEVKSDNAPLEIEQNALTINTPGQLNLSTSYVKCVKKDTNIACNQKELDKGENVTYKVVVKNSGSGAAYNVKVTNKYNKNNLSLISNIKPNAFFDAGAGNIVWFVGSVNGGETKELSFDAKISEEAKSGDNIANNVIISSDGYPNQEESSTFVLLKPIENNKKNQNWWQNISLAFFAIIIAISLIYRRIFGFKLF